MTTPSSSPVERLRGDQAAEAELLAAVASLRRAAELTSCRWHRRSLLRAAARLERL